MADEPTYGAAGVSLATAGAVVERLRAAVESTGAEGFGAFAGLYPLDERRLLAASMDSIGTKPMVARERGLLRTCGADMAAQWAYLLVAGLGLAGIAWICGALSLALLGATTVLGRAFEARRHDAAVKGPAS